MRLHLHVHVCIDGYVFSCQYVLRWRVLDRDKDTGDSDEHHSLRLLRPLLLSSPERLPSLSLFLSVAISLHTPVDAILFVLMTLETFYLAEIPRQAGQARRTATSSTFARTLPSTSAIYRLCIDLGMQGGSTGHPSRSSGVSSSAFCVVSAATASYQTYHLHGLYPPILQDKDGNAPCLRSSIRYLYMYIHTCIYSDVCTCMRGASAVFLNELHVLGTRFCPWTA